MFLLFYYADLSGVCTNCRLSNTFLHILSHAHDDRHYRNITNAPREIGKGLKMYICDMSANVVNYVHEFWALVYDLNDCGYFVWYAWRNKCSVTYYIVWRVIILWIPILFRSTFVSISLALQLVQMVPCFYNHFVVKNQTNIHIPRTLYLFYTPYYHDYVPAYFMEINSGQNIL